MPCVADIFVLNYPIAPYLRRTRMQHECSPHSFVAATSVVAGLNLVPLSKIRLDAFTLPVRVVLHSPVSQNDLVASGRLIVGFR